MFDPDRRLALTGDPAVRNAEDVRGAVGTLFAQAGFESLQSGDAHLENGWRKGGKVDRVLGLGVAVVRH